MYLISQPFPSHQNFLDPQLTDDGQPYGPTRYKEIVKERYLISKNINTSYNDSGELTPLERTYILQFIMDDMEKQKAAISALQNTKTSK